MAATECAEDDGEACLSTFDGLWGTWGFGILELECMLLSPEAELSLGAGGTHIHILVSEKQGI